MTNGKFTYDQEGQSHGRYNSRVLHFPEGRSGVTLGRGYDMKRRSENEIVCDLVSAGIERARAIEFARGARLEGRQAREFVNTHRDHLGEITESQQEKLFERVYPEYVRRTEAYYNKHTSGIAGRVPFHELDNNLREVLIDTVYQGLARESTYKSAAQNNARELRLNILERSDGKYPDRNRDRFNHMGVDD